MSRTVIDVQQAGGVDPARLERGVQLVVEGVGPGRYVVTGGREPHYVDLVTPNQPRCDCGDHLWRDRVCKHLLACLMREGDEYVLRSVGELVRGLRELAKAA